MVSTSRTRRCFPRWRSAPSSTLSGTRGTPAPKEGLSGPNGAERHWLVNPLCGTRNFAARTPLVAVKVAMHGTGGVLAAGTDPFSSEVFRTGGEGAHVRSEAGGRTAAPRSG